MAPVVAMSGSTLAAVAEEAQRALRDRPRISLRRRLTIGLLAWFVLSLGITVLSVLLIGRVRAKLATVGAVDRYTFEIQQARRYEKNFFLYGTNLPDALDQLHAAQRILEQESNNMAAVIGDASVDLMQAHVRRYAELWADGDFDLGSVVTDYTFYDRDDAAVQLCELGGGATTYFALDLSHIS